MGDAKRKLEEKQEAFEKEPERFVDKCDIIFAAIVKENNEGQKGIAYLANDGMPENSFKIALFDITQQIEMLLLKRKALAEAENVKNNRVILPGQGNNGR